MTSPHSQKKSPYVLLAIAAAAGTIGIFFWAKSTRPPAPATTSDAKTPELSSTPAIPADEAPETTAAPSEAAEPELELPPTEESAENSDTSTEGHEETVHAEHPRSPRLSEEELFGPLPTQAADEQVATLPTLHEPIPFNVPPPPRIDPLPTAPQQNSTAAAAGSTPSRVLLRRTVQFPVVINGKSAGSVQVPARTPVTVRRVLPGGRLEVAYHQSVTAIPVAFTDYHLRVRPSTPTSNPAQRQIVTFPEQTLNPRIGSGAFPSATPRREIPIQ